MFNTGDIIASRYEIEECTGIGGMAVVYKAKDLKLGRTVALKILKEEFSTDHDFLKKFKNEAMATATLSDSNIVAIFDTVDDDEEQLHCIVMEFVEGITVKKYIEIKGKLSNKETISTALQAAEGIKAAHKKGIIHRDIKPQNMILSKDGKVKVADFGIARDITAETKGTVIGSVHYIAPEQASGGEADQRSDLYSLGISMYEMITGRLPYEGDNAVGVALAHVNDALVPPDVYAKDIYPALNDIIIKATRKDPALRYASAEDIIRDLRQCLRDPDGRFVDLFGAGSASGQDKNAEGASGSTEQNVYKSDIIENAINENRHTAGQTGTLGSLSASGSILSSGTAAGQSDPAVAGSTGNLHTAAPQTGVGANGTSPAADGTHDGGEGNGSLNDPYSYPAAGEAGEAGGMNAPGNSSETGEPAGAAGADGLTGADGINEVNGAVSGTGTDIQGKSGSGRRFDPLSLFMNRYFVAGLSAFFLIAVIFFIMLSLGRFGLGYARRHIKHEETSVQSSENETDAAQAESNYSIDIEAAAQMPDLKGLTVDAAVEKLSSLNVELNYDESDYSDVYYEGLIMEQLPAADENIQQGSTVYVTVSLGSRLNYIINSVKGKDPGTAAGILTGNGFKISADYTYEYSSDIAAGMVIDCEPVLQQGEESRDVKEGDTLRLKISAGNAGLSAGVPQLVGLSLNDAVTAIISGGYTIGNVTGVVVDGVDNGIVTGQSAAAGTVILPGQPIDLEVCVEAGREGETVTIAEPAVSPLSDDYFYGSIDTECVIGNADNPGQASQQILVVIRLMQTVDGVDEYTVIDDPRPVGGGTRIPVSYRNIKGAWGVDSGMVQVVNAETEEVYYTFGVSFAPAS